MRTLTVLFFFCIKPVFSQLHSMRACGPSAHYESSFNHFRDTVVYYEDGYKEYTFQIVDATHGVYTDYARESGEKITHLEYRIEKDTFFFERVEIWSNFKLKSVAVYNESATSCSITYYFDKSDQVWLKFNRIVYKEPQKHHGYTGLYQEYYKDGILRMEGNCENGCRTGIWKNYHPNGQLESIGKYAESYTHVDCPVGEGFLVHYTFWNSKSGKTKVVISEGHDWNDNRELKDAYEMERDGTQWCGGHVYYHRHGIWQYYDDQGTLIDTKRWKYGELRK